MIASDKLPVCSEAGEAEEAEEQTADESNSGHGDQNKKTNKREADLTPEERERGERWLRFWRQLRGQRRAAVLVSTGGKTQKQIVEDAVRAMRKAGLLQETPRSRQIK